MAESRHAVGVDWASGHWLAVEYRNDEYEDITVETSFEALWRTFEEKPDKVLVDVPIGLCDESDDESSERSRECDTLARRVLGSRSSSVFTPPARQAAYEAREEKPHGTVSETNRELVGKGLSIQTYHIAPGIAELDSFLNPDDDEDKKRRRKRVEEAHPEVCFAAFDDSVLEYAKTSAVGVSERLSALENVVDEPGKTFLAISRDLSRHADEFDVTAIDADDVLDAMALAITASADENERQTLPEDPPRDSLGLPMQMVYRSETPFEVE
ncbi:DUF429 domain-containing protein [Natrarchaeobaculum sulfurireducens]|uniref:Nuclease (RNAse H fold) n=1 Tax=Natrarchaeobaculum sulfurireducens TaxID=2044521 RepID=A0A346PK59_9EURY|nr:DUF429 domain-containing protein [Natrarchaeobaculum sulfurireducens]AXR79904.1 Putative nuclease (RNAse H fold) [Natrarchaeobaculum sulfurireducens]